MLVGWGCVSKFMLKKIAKMGTASLEKQIDLRVDFISEIREALMDEKYSWNRYPPQMSLT